MPPSWTNTIDNLYTTTWANRRPEAMLQAYLKTPLAFWLKQNERVINQAGYTRIEAPVEYGSNSTVKWLGKGGTIALTDDEIVTMCYDDWKYVAVNIIRYGTDDQKNRGKARLLNLLETKMNAAERALNEEFERAFFADGTGTDEPNGLQNLIADTPTSGTVHNLNRATYDWWRNQTKASTGAASVYLVSDMRNLMNTCTKYAKTEQQDIIIYTDQTSYELYEDELLEQKRTVNQKAADADFEHVTYKGRPIFWSPSAPAGKMYFINTKYLRLIIDQDYYMQMTDWKPIPNQVNDRTAQILCTQNLMTTRPVTHGVLTGIAA